jgi:hypothetical protein
MGFIQQVTVIAMLISSMVINYNRRMYDWPILIKTYIRFIKYRSLGSAVTMWTRRRHDIVDLCLFIYLFIYSFCLRCIERRIIGSDCATSKTE